MRRGARARRALAAVCGFACAFTCLAALFGCGAGVSVGEDSPTVSDVAFCAGTTATEAGQSIEVRIEFDRQISVSGDAADDFEVLLNGEELDADAVKLEVNASADAITFVLSPADGASVGPSAGGSYFAVYQGQISIASAREDGALPHVTGTDGSTAVLSEAIEGTLPSGLAIEVTEQREGSAADGVPAQTTFTVTSPATARCITWFSPDGGTTKLLKHNHDFASADAAACAADLAEVVNAAEGLGLVATVSGTSVTLTATEVVDGQVIEPVIVEGAGVSGGVYDEEDDGTGE